MANKKYVVREGFVFRTQNDNGSFKTYEGGDIVNLEELEGDASHQLERASKPTAPVDPAA
jgi:hypothetical protein